MGFAASDVVPFTQAGAQRALADIQAGRTVEADGAIAQLQQRRAAATRMAPPARPASKRG